MRKQTENLSQSEPLMKQMIPSNFAYVALVDDLRAAKSTWRSANLASKLNAKNFKPLSKKNKVQRAGRIGINEKTPTHMFYYPILEYMASNSRQVMIKDMYRHLETTFNFTNVDLETMGGTKNEPRWKVTLRWAKEELIEKGLIKRSGTRGKWELTSAGYRWFLKNVD